MQHEEYTFPLLAITKPSWDIGSYQLVIVKCGVVISAKVVSHVFLIKGGKTIHLIVNGRITRNPTHRVAYM